MKKSDKYIDFLLTVEEIGKVTGKDAVIIVDNVIELSGIERKLHRINERQCNGYQNALGNWDQAAADKDDKKEEKLQGKANNVVNELGLFIEFQGDPRGAAIKLYRSAKDRKGFRNPIYLPD
jgi:hypothetical protein